MQKKPYSRLISHLAVVHHETTAHTPPHKTQPRQPTRTNNHLLSRLLRFLFFSDANLAMLTGARERVRTQRISGYCFVGICLSVSHRPRPCSKLGLISCHLGPGTYIIVPGGGITSLRTAWQIGAGLKEVFGQDSGNRGPVHLFACLSPNARVSMYFRVLLCIMYPIMRPHRRHCRSSTAVAERIPHSRYR